MYRLVAGYMERCFQARWNDFQQLIFSFDRSIGYSRGQTISIESLKYYALSYIISICLHSFGALAKARLFTASLQRHKVSYQTCSIDSFVDLQPFCCNLKVRLFVPLLWGVEGHDGLRVAFDSSLMSSYYLPIDTNVLSLTVLGLFSWLQMSLRPPAHPDTMTITALQDIASSSVKNIWPVNHASQVSLRLYVHRYSI